VVQGLWRTGASMGDSLFLCAKPSFAEGASRLLDFGNCLNEYNRSLTPDQADLLALSVDWRLVGGDWARATKEIGTQVQPHTSRNK
jgi:hypothetical protein